MVLDGNKDTNCPVHSDPPHPSANTCVCGNTVRDSDGFCLDCKRPNIAKATFEPIVITSIVDGDRSTSANCRDCNDVSHGAYGAGARDEVERIAMEHVAKTGHTVVLKTREVLVRPKP